MSRHESRLSALIAVAVALALMAPAAAQARSINLILDYTVAKPCPVFPNYPKAGVRGNNIGWTVAPGDAVGWRYNVNRTWAMVSDKKYRGNKVGHPWWGFVQRQCIGTSIGGEHFPTPTSHYPAGRPIPNRLLQGRSVHGVHHYRAVRFRVPGATVVNPRKQACSRGTLRDAANRFVIGNVAKSWHLRLTAVQRSGWTKVYVPAAERWGWLQDTHLRGC